MRGYLLKKNVEKVAMKSNKSDKYNRFLDGRIKELGIY